MRFCPYVILIASTLMSCAHHSDLKKNDIIFFDNPTQDQAAFGGFSGLYYLKDQSNDKEQIFLSITDRGPNGSSFDFFYNSKQTSARVFKNPKFNPHIIKFKLKNRQISILEKLALKDPKGEPLTGLPNSQELDEVPLDSTNQVLNFDLLGIDPESLTLDREQNLWVGEEYRPSLLKFSKDGLLIHRYVPKNSFTKAEKQKIEQKYGKNVFKEALPEILNKREQNRGFEAIAFQNGILFFMPQSTLLLNSQSKKESSVVRIFAFDTQNEKINAQYIYLMEKPHHKIGDMAINEQGELFVLEQDGLIGPNGFRKIFKVKPEPIFNILNEKNKTNPEEMPSIAVAQNYPVLKKELTLDLALKGYNFAEKIEGLTLLPNDKMAVVNDNDFAIDPKKPADENKIGLGIYEEP